MFLTNEDYEVICDERSFDVIIRSETKIRNDAEAEAMEEVASYLRSRYDMEKAFAAEGSDRNPKLVGVTAKIALYYLIHSLPQYMALDAYKDLYDEAVAWLGKVQQGRLQPDLPTYDGENGEADASNPMRYGSQPANSYGY